MEQLDQQRERIQADLRGLVSGEVRCDSSFLQLYSSDGSIFEIRPLAVVRPRSTADVAAVAQYASQMQIPLHARGAGSGVAGESLGPGLVLDFSKYLRRIIHTEEDSVRVQPGLVHERLNEHLRLRGRVFGPDPANSHITTIGGMLGINAVGSRRVKYGATRDNVGRMQIVLTSGEVLDVGREPVVPPPESTITGRKQEIVARVARLLADNAELIAAHQPHGRTGYAGYDLTGVLADGYLDLPRLLVGSEGTLAFVTEATLVTRPLARHRGAALLLFDSLERAARTALELQPFRPTACDLMDRRHLSLAREADTQFQAMLPNEAEAALLVEYEGDDPLEVRQRVQQLLDEVRHVNRRAFGARAAFDPAETEMLWRLASGFQPAFYRMRGPARPVPVADDMTVAPECVPELLVRIQNALKRHEVTGSVFAHMNCGRVHLQPFMDLTNPEIIEQIRTLCDDVYAAALDLGGTVGGEYGVGLSRTAYLSRQYGPLYEVFRELKRIFDPAGLLNPGKIVAEGGDPLLHHLRPPIRLAAPTTTAASDTPQLRNLVELQLDWDPARVAPRAQACFGCGECRTQWGGMRMCPIFRFAPAEEASPRAKVNVLRGVLTGTLDLSVLTSADFKQIADLCVHCHMCRLECPAAVDIPALMREGKGAYVAANGLSVSDWAMTRLDGLGRWASRFSPLVNWSLGNRQMRWFLEKAFGIAQGRKLPRVAARSFLRRSARRRWGRPSRRAAKKVLYFVDVYANYFDPQLAEALVAVLEHNGIEVFVHPDQLQAGMPAIARGDLDFARRLAQHNVTVLGEAVRQGYHILASEPSAALCLTREYPQLIDDEDVRMVAANASDACDYLWQMHVLGKLQLDFKPLNLSLAYHTPCHLKALERGTPGRSLLGLIPGLQVEMIEEGCSGMAGTFGLQRVNYRSSLRAGWGLISRLRDPNVQAGTTECSTCKMQMEQGTSKPTIHPIKLMALAYGLVPEIARLLNAPGEELFVS